MAKSTRQKKPAPVRMELAKGEAVSHGIRRACLDLFRNASALLANRKQSERATEEAIHEVRKRLKRVRTLLRFAKKFDSSRELVLALELAQESARTIAVIRDSDVLIKTLSLMEGSSMTGSPTLIDSIRSALMARQTKKTMEAAQELNATSNHEANNRLGVAERLLRKAGVTLMAAALEQLDKWEPSDIAFADAVKQVARDYRKARRAYLELKDSEVFASALAPAEKREELVMQLHNARMRFKHVLYGIEFLRGLRAKAPSHFAKQLSDFEEKLGVHHDFTILKETLADAQQLLPQHANELVLNLLEQHRVECEHQIAELANSALKRRPRKLKSLLSDLSPD